MTKVKGSFFRANMVSIWMNTLRVGLLTTRTVDELLWGYRDPLLVRVSSTNPDVETVFGLMYKAWTLNPASVKNHCYERKYALFLFWKLEHISIIKIFVSVQKNGSNDGEFVYHTGQQNYMDYGRVKTWKGQR